jgi:osmotically-inducible protein OsmY
MNKMLWLVPVLLSGSLIATGCKDANAPSTNAPATPSVSGPSPDRAATSTSKMSDSDLEKAIRAKLESDEATRQANLSVDADADENKATLKGKVTSQDVRTKAVELARSVQPGLTVNDEIEVQPAG